MNHTESAYIEAGRAFEQGRKTGEALRKMLESEHVHDKPEARRLIEQGRTEARKS